jgi:uncharacterized protein YqkB
MIKKNETPVKSVPAITREASLAGRALARLETAAAAALNGGVPTMQLVADTAGITAIIKDEHGTSVIIQKGKISVNVATAE